MKKKKSTYLGGEEIEQRVVIPKEFEKFFDKRALFIVLIIVFLLIIRLLV
jgi:hypothetical protein